MSDKVRVLVVGCGHMGASHALAYHKLDGFEVAGVVSRGPESRQKLSKQLGGVPEYDNYEKALEISKPDAVCISTYPDTHEDFCLKALDAGCHVFVEKPLATTLEGAERVIQKAKEKNLKLIVGYILRVHPAWKKFIELAQTLGKPLVMRMNLNQQSSEHSWITHKNLMESMSPIVDCGVHYVDVMSQMTGAKPTHIHAIGANLSNEIAKDMYNYGQLQIKFDDGSVGWYEAAWGPSVSETAFFVKDVIGPKGCVSIVKDPNEAATDSSDINTHTKTNSLLYHSGELDENGKFVKKDEIINTKDEPDHNGLCLLEQENFLKAIKEDIDLSESLVHTLNSMKMVLAADESIRTGEIVKLDS